MQAKLTTSIDQYLKTSFEVTHELHGLTFSDILENTIRQVLAEVNPLEFLRIEIAQKELELSELRKRYAEIEVLESQKKQIVKKPIFDDNEQLFAEKREELFREGPGTIMNQLKRNQNPAWGNVYIKYGFSNAKEMETYVRTEAIKRGIL
ncbi:MAG: hypothetical protein RBR35_16970 [Salinivirgaceae bacterium]|nr:hypothetical protein [Salinivirgaceae bacterium]